MHVHLRNPVAVVEVARNDAAYCAEHFVDHVRGQVRAAIDRYAVKHPETAQPTCAFCRTRGRLFKLVAVQ